MTNTARARPWLVLAGLAPGVTVTHGFARLAYGLLLPAMKSELVWTYSQAGWLNAANALGYLAGAVLTMLLIRRISPARLFAFGMVATALALLATGLHAGLGWQTFWRFAAGLLGATTFTTADTLAAGLFPGDARRSALAIAILFGVGGGPAGYRCRQPVRPAAWPVGGLAAAHPSPARRASQVHACAGTSHAACDGLLCVFRRGLFRLSDLPVGVDDRATREPRLHRLGVGGAGHLHPCRWP